MKSKKFLFISVVCLVFFGTFLVGGVKKASAAQPCSCHDDSTVASRVGQEIMAENEPQCDQYCANEKVKNPTITRYRFGDGGVLGASRETITKSPNNETVTGIPIKSCECNNGNSSKVFNSNECMLFCVNSGATEFNYEYRGMGSSSVMTEAINTRNNSSSNGGPAISSNVVPGNTVGISQVITCGRPGQSMCTLCDLIAGLNNIIKFLMKIAVGVALLVMTIGGVMYVVSAGDKGLADKGKGAVKNALIGFAIIFAGYLIINTTISYLGSRKDENGNVTFGMNITSWGNFDCRAMDRGGN